METHESTTPGLSASAAAGVPAHGDEGGTTAPVKEKAQRVAGQARAQVAARLAPGVARLKEPAATVLGHYAEAVRQLSQQYHGQNRGIAGQYADRTAGQIQRLADYLQHTEVDELVQELEAVARRRPAVFLGAAFTLGAAAARFVKSSPRQHVGKHAQQPDAAASAFADVADRDTAGNGAALRGDASFGAPGTDVADDFGPR
jgi:hypothetical protein